MLKQLLLNKLKEAQAPMTRRELAQAIGRTGTLSRYDITLLDELVSAGRVRLGERRMGPVLTATTYEAV